MDKIADSYLSREAWLDIVKPVEMAGRLDHVAAKPPRNKREKKTAMLQNHYLSKRSVGMFSDPNAYERIQWKNS